MPPGLDPRRGFRIAAGRPGSVRARRVFYDLRQQIRDFVHRLEEHIQRFFVLPAYLAHCLLRLGAYLAHCLLRLGACLAHHALDVGACVKRRPPQEYAD